MLERNGWVQRRGHRSQSFASRGCYECLLIGQILQGYLRQVADDMLVLTCQMYFEFWHEADRSSQVMTYGKVAYLVGGRMVYYTVMRDLSKYWPFGHTLEFREGCEGLMDAIREEIRCRNPLRRRHVRLFRDDDCVSAEVCASPRASWDDLVLSARLKEDLYANTIEHLQTQGGINTVVLHGPNGAGKTLACQALATEALQRGFTVAQVVRKLNFSGLERFIRDYLGLCLLIFEDVDELLVDLVRGRSGYLADISRSLAGLVAFPWPVAVVVTVARQEVLDEVREWGAVCWSRQYHFDYPSDAGLDRLLDRCFGKESLSDELRSRCHGRRYTGAHVRELHRTAQLLAYRHEKPAHEMLPHAGDIVARQFSLGQPSPGERCSLERKI